MPETKRLVGTDPNQVPRNKDLGGLAYQDADAIAGPVVIGSQSSSPALRVNQTGAGNAFVVEDATSPDSTPFVIDANGQVVVGETTAPVIQGFTRALTISGATTSPALLRYSANNEPAFLIFSKTRGTTSAEKTVVVDGDRIGTLIFTGSDGTNDVAAATITAAVDGVPGANDMPGRISLLTTADGQSNPTERMRIKSNGSVRFIPQTTPAAAEAGDVYYDSGTNKLRCYNGTVWNDLF